MAVTASDVPEGACRNWTLVGESSADVSVPAGIVRQQLALAAEQLDSPARTKPDRGVELLEVVEIELRHRHAKKFALRPAQRRG